MREDNRLKKDVTIFSLLVLMFEKCGEYTQREVVLVMHFVPDMTD